MSNAGDEEERPDFSIREVCFSGDLKDKTAARVERLGICDSAAEQEAAEDECRTLARDFLDLYGDVHVAAVLAFALELIDRVVEAAPERMLNDKAFEEIAGVRMRCAQTLINKGVSLREIERLLGLCKKTLYAHGITSPGDRKADPIDTKRLERARHLIFNEGYNRSAAAKEAGVSLTSLYYHGVVQPDAQHPEKLERARHLISNEGYSNAAAAKEAGVSLACLRSHSRPYAKKAP